MMAVVRRFYVALMVFVLVFPLVPLGIMAFSFRWDWPHLLPNRWWWGARESARLPIGWDYLISSSSQLPQALLHTAIIGSIVSMLAIILSLPVARWLVYQEERPLIRRWTEALFVMPLIVPEIAIASGLLLMALHLNIAGSHLAVVIGHCLFALPYSFRILLSAYQGLPQGYTQQAELLGTTPWQRWLYIEMPLLLPSLVAAGLFAFLVSSNLYLVTILLSQGEIPTLATLLFSSLGTGGLDAISAEIALVASLPALVILFVAEGVFRTSLAKLAS